MPIWLDKRYANLVANRLDNFKWKKPLLANFRCPYCGDSQKNKRKARGYLYENEGNFFYKCWNCPESTTFPKFLQYIAPELYLEYVRESFSERANNQFSLDSLKNEKMKPVVTRYPKFEALKFCSRITQLNPDHPARVYLSGRKIPVSHYHNLLFADSIRLFVTSNFDKSQVYLPALSSGIVILIRDEKGNIVACNIRSLDVQANVKYIKAKVHEDITPIYGIEKVKKDEKIYVFEGEFNSMFVKNAIAVGGVAVMNGIENVLGVNKDFIVQVVDNDPRNPDVVKTLEKLVNEEYGVVILPNYIEESDINDLVVHDKLTSNTVAGFLETNTYNGLSARLKLSEWRKCNGRTTTSFSGGR